MLFLVPFCLTAGVHTGGADVTGVELVSLSAPLARRTTPACEVGRLQVVDDGIVEGSPDVGADVHQCHPVSRSRILLATCEGVDYIRKVEAVPA